MGRRRHRSCEAAINVREVTAAFTNGVSFAIFKIKCQKLNK